MNDKPKTLCLNVNKICNNSCLYCLRNPEEEAKLAITNAYKTMKEAYDEFGMQKIIFSHTEPTLCSDLVDYISYAKKIGYRSIGIITNGRRLKYMPYSLSLIKSGANNFGVSFHGPKAEIHDKVTQVKGSYDQTLRGLKNLFLAKRKYKDIYINITCLLTNLNYKYIQEIWDTFKNSSLDQLNFVVIKYVGDAERNSEALLFKYSEVVKEIEKFYQNNSLTKEQKNIITFDNLPKCLYFPDKEIYFSSNEWYLKSEGKWKISSTDWKNRYRKTTACQECIFNNECYGIFKKYLDYYGEDEFKPVKYESN